MQAGSGPLAPQPPPGYKPSVSRPYNPWAIVSVCFGASTIIGSWCFGGLGNLALVGLIVGYVAIGLTFLFIAVYIAFFVFVFAFAATHANATPNPTSVP